LSGPPALDSKVYCSTLLPERHPAESGAPAKIRAAALIHSTFRRERHATNNSDIEKNISDSLGAIVSLAEIESVDISSIRLSLDKLLRFWEGSWYLNSVTKNKASSQNVCREGD